MNKLIIFIMCLFISMQTSALDLSNSNKGEFDITNVYSSEKGITISGEGNVGKYGKVLATWTLYTNGWNKTHGLFEGFARNFNPESEMVQAYLRGVWSGGGTTFRIHSLDDLSNGEQNFVIWDVDLKNNKVFNEVVLID